MCSVLRGLLLSPVSATSVEHVPPQSVGTLRRHPQHYVKYDSIIDQSDCSKSSEYDGFNKRIFAANGHNSVSNVKMEQNISDEMFWMNTSNSEDKTIQVKTEDINRSECMDIAGVYYKYTIDSTGQEGWYRQEASQQSYDSPTQVKSPQLDHKSHYILVKEKSKVSKSSAMNVRSDTLLATPPRAFSPTGVPDFTQEAFIASSFGSGYGYEDPFSQFDDSLLTPPESLDYPKLGSMTSSQGDLSLTECGGVFENCAGLDMDPDWLNEPITLHTPEEQEGDVTFFTQPSPLTAYTFTDVPLTTTPEPSHPSTPLSSSPASDVDEVLSLFDDQSHNDYQSYLPNEYLPFGASFDSSPDSSQYSSPALTPVQSPFPSSDFSQFVEQDLSPVPSSLSSSSSIKDLLAREESSSPPGTPQARKRKTPLKPDTGESSAPKSKRRLSAAAKKDRKREQNKTAALRYRQKKKEEKNGCFSTLETLEAKNSQLKKTVSVMTAEIKYLKKLWSEVSAAQKLKQQKLCLC